MWYCSGMSEDKRTLWDQRKDTREAYNKGVSEGRDQIVWIVIGVAVVVAIIASYFPS